ncbi:helix-turn-helix domain-containing protein [Agrobacterium vitis]|uniref:helix-turn-helix domain-containing protein n=1 Tax=Agrobacterium vitis TaxID=373 RepID=UPI0018D60593
MQLISSSVILLDAVARAGSFRGAAEKLNMSASVINRQIIIWSTTQDCPCWKDCRMVCCPQQRGSVGWRYVVFAGGIQGLRREGLLSQLT